MVGIKDERTEALWGGGRESISKSKMVEWRGE